MRYNMSSDQITNTNGERNMNQTHNDLYGSFQEIGETDILYEQVHIDHSSGILVLRNIKEVPDHLYRYQ